MNERIRKLARQSGLIQYDTDSKLVEVEKFAELIVRECIVQCERGWISFCMDPVHNQAIDSCVNRIKKDFGVK